MNEGAIADDLVGLGLTQYEAKAYVALVRRDSSTAAQVSRLAGVPRQRIYRRPLQPGREGPCRLAAGRRRQVHGRRTGSGDRAPGRTAAGGSFSRAESKAAAALLELTPAYVAGQQESDPLEYIEVLRDRRAINERFDELQRGIQREILVFTRPPYATPAQENVGGLQVAHDHVARSVYELSAFDDPAFIAAVEGFLDAGEEARFVAHLPLKLVIIDESIVLFGMERPRRRLGRSHPARDRAPRAGPDSQDRLRSGVGDRPAAGSTRPGQRCRHRARTPAEASLTYPAITTAPLR